MPLMKLKPNGIYYLVELNNAVLQFLECVFANTVSVISIVERKIASLWCLTHTWDETVLKPTVTGLWSLVENKITGASVPFLILTVVT